MCLKDIAEIIQKRSKLIFNLTIDIMIKKFSYQKKFLIYPSRRLNFNPINKKIDLEIDQILKFLKKILC